MFRIQNRNEELLARPFNREQLWSSVELSTDDLWFYVSTIHSLPGDKRRTFRLLIEVSELVDIIRDTSNFFWVEQVMLVAPPRISGVGCSKMYRLKELIMIVDSTDFFKVSYAYLLDDDPCYKAIDFSEVNPRSLRQVVYSEEKHAYPESICS